MEPLQLFHWTRFWRATKFFMAPLLVVIMATMGCGRMPGQTFPSPGSRPGRQVQAVSTHNVGVGYSTITNQFFLFSDYEAAKLAPEAVGAFLVALEGYEIFGAVPNYSGRIDARVRTPSGWEALVSTGIDRFYYGNGEYDWPAEMASTNRDVTTAQFSSVTSIASTLTASPSSAPRDVVSEATASGTRTTGSVWADVRLVLAAIGVWARVQPQSAWSGGGGGSGQTASGSTETVWPARFIAVASNLSSRSVSLVEWMPESSSNSAVVKLESVEFASGSTTPSAISIGVRHPSASGQIDILRYSLANLHATDWRDLLASQLPPLDEAVLQEQLAAFSASSPSIVGTSTQDLVDAALSNPIRSTAKQEAALILAAIASLNFSATAEEIPMSLPMESNEVVPQATLAISYNPATDERQPITDPTTLSQAQGDPGKFVVWLKAAGLTPDGRARTLTYQVNYAGSVRAYKLWFAVPRAWVDPGPNFVVSQEDWSSALDHFNSGYAPYKVQWHGAAVLAVEIFVGLIAAAVGLWTILPDTTPSPSPTPTLTPTPTPAPEPTPRTYRIWVHRDAYYLSPTSFPAGTFDLGPVTLDGPDDQFVVLPINNSDFGYLVARRPNGTTYSPWGASQPINPRTAWGQCYLDGCQYGTF
ncbi:MAG: hypothetical protein FJZ01_16740 [Candidatus Sericytochromatia bacterium]|nr:hypothetical protein [Candidatus Tanganyikabacteria bacterium]